MPYISFLLGDCMGIVIPEDRAYPEMLVCSVRHCLGSIERFPDRPCAFPKPDWVSSQKWAEGLAKMAPGGQEDCKP